jgi:hypothetical protein
VDGFQAILGDWHFWVLVVAFYAFMATVSGMPAPDDSSSKGYRWLYASLHTFAGNIDKVFSSKIQLPVQPKQ